MSSKPLAIGIDLGTTNSCVAIYRRANVEVIANDSGSRTTPSCVAFSEAGRFYGEAAMLQTAKNMENTIFDVKRLIGREYSDEAVQKDMKHWPFQVINKDGKPKIKISLEHKEQTYYPEVISSMVLANMKETAETFIGETVTSAVITVPAYFNDYQRQSTKDAAKIAGLEVLAIINEPTAAAMAYGFNKNSGKKNTVLVFDLGGGTFDVSILTILNQNYDVKATAGDTHLGGQDLTNRLVEYFVKELESKHNVIVGSNKKALYRLRKECEKAKRTLSSNPIAHLDILIESKELFLNINRARFEELNSDLFMSMIDCVSKILRDAKLEKAAIDEVVLVGGSTRIPKVQNMLQEYFPNKELKKTVNADEAVASGAAIHAAVLSGRISNVVLKDVVPLSLGVKTGREERMSWLIPRNTPIPTTKTETYQTIADNQLEIFISVYEGEKEFVRENNFLGEFNMTGIKPSRAGKEKFNLTFSIDANGILTVSAVDKRSKQRKHIKITKNSRLTQDEIERLIQDENKAVVEDGKSKANKSGRMALESLCLKIKNFLISSDVPETFGEADTHKVFEYYDQAMTMLNTERMQPLEEYKRCLEELQNSCKPFMDKYNTEK